MGRQGRHVPVQPHRRPGRHARAGTIGPTARQPGRPDRPIEARPIPVTGARRSSSTTTATASRSPAGSSTAATAIPELFGKYVFGDLAIRGNARRASTAGCSTPTCEAGTINEFLLPQFANGQLPNGLTVHGFGEDASGELYALVTNTPANGTGGIVYKFGACRSRAWG